MLATNPTHLGHLCPQPWQPQPRSRSLCSRPPERCAGERCRPGRQVLGGVFSRLSASLQCWCWPVLVLPRAGPPTHLPWRHLWRHSNLTPPLPPLCPAGAVLGAKVAPFWDPAIAIALSLWVVWAWGGQAQEHLLNLVGRSAPPDLLQRLTYLAFYHDERVQKIDTVR